MANAEKNGKMTMTVKDKMQLAELATKFNISPAKKADADGVEKDYYEIVPKADNGANLVCYMSEDGEYEVFPTTTDVPLNIPVFGDMVRYCKLLAK
jgi:hypothetical protein